VSARFTAAPNGTNTVIYNSQGKAEPMDFSPRKRLKFVGAGAPPYMMIATHVKGDACLDAVAKGSTGFVSDEFKRTGAHDVMLASSMDIGVRFDKAYTFSAADVR